MSQERTYLKDTSKNYVFVVLLGQRCFAHPVHAGMRDIVSLWAVNKVKHLFFCQF